MPTDTKPSTAATANPRLAAVADLSAGELLDWDGNAIEQADETYDEYINRMPSRADLKRYPAPVYYWEVRYPGVNLQPYPRMGALRSTDSGVWAANNAVQEQAVREHIAVTARVDPDDLKMTADELAIMDGKAKGGIRYCQNAGCRFACCSMTAIDLHESLTGHRTDSRPRKDA